MKNYFITIKKLWQIFKPFHKFIYLQTFLIFLLQIITIGLTLLTSHLINNILTKNVKIIAFIIIALLVAKVLETILNYYKNIIDDSFLSRNIGQYLQEYSFKKLFSLTISQQLEDNSAFKQSLINQGEQSAINTISTIFITIIPTCIFILISFFTLSYYSISLGIFTLIVMVVLFYWKYKFRIFHQPMVRKNRDNWLEQAKIRTEAFTHFLLVKNFAQENYFIKKYALKRLSIINYEKMARGYVFRNILKNSLYIDVTEVLLLSLTSYLFIVGEFKIGTLYLVLSLSSRMYSSISTFSNVLRDMPIWFTNIEKYIEVIEKTPIFNEEGILTEINEDIVFSSVSFKYPHGEQIYSNLSLHIPKGKITAFVGHSGSGKSTIIKLLTRSYDYSAGSIQIGTTELRDIDASYLRKNIGYVEQHVDLFDDTVEENILFGVKDEERVEAQNKLEEVAQKARITEFYNRLGEKRFGAFVGERGIKLSGGERQRIGIARAIIKNPKILIFDEATSSLDTENEKYIQEAIEEVSKGKTTIIIAHRLSTIKGADKIIVMDKGTIVAEGTHEELLKNSKHYQTLVEHQLS